MNDTQAQELLLALQSANFGLEWWSYVLIAIVSSVGGYIGAYMRRRGKLRAERKDFERILREQRRTTDELERIRDEITQATWHKNQLWVQRRDVYAQLLPKLNKVIDSFWEVTTFGYDPKTRVPTPDLPQAISAARKLEDSLNAWMEVTGLSEVFLGEDAVIALGAYKRASSELNKEVQNAEAAVDYFKRQKAAADQLYQQLITAAKVDLGILQRPRTKPNNALQPTA